MPVDSWDSAQLFYSRFDYIIICKEYLTLLEKLRPSWEDKLDLFTSHFDLCFTHPNDFYPFGEYITVTRISSITTIALLNKDHIVVTSSMVEPKKDPLLKVESMLVQLVGEK